MEDYIISTNNDPFNGEIINFALFVDCESIDFEEASNNLHWRKAMDEEIHVIEKNETWKLTDLPANEKPIGIK